MKRTLDADDIVIAEPRGPLALAGTMGGLESEIDDDSHSVAIEAVHFSAHAVARMSRRHKLSSEASRRFERGVDPELPAIASARAAALLIELGGATYVGASRVDAVAPVEPVRIPADLPERLSGLPISADRAITRLESVGATLTVEGTSLVVTPPSWRPDLTDPADLVEEVVRLEGYENLPVDAAQGPSRVRPDGRPAPAPTGGSHAGRVRTGRGPELPVPRAPGPGRPRHHRRRPALRARRAGQPAVR